MNVFLQTFISPFLIVPQFQSKMLGQNEFLWKKNYMQSISKNHI